MQGVEHISSTSSAADGETIQVDWKNCDELVIAAVFAI
jgi:hypothetical protein